METTPSYMLDNSLEGHMQEILAEEIIKNLRPFVEQYIVEVRQYVHESLVAGFDRAAVQNIVPLMVSQIGNLCMMAEDALVQSNSPKAALLKSELQALKAYLGVYFKGMEKNLLEEPDIDRQMFLDNMPKIRSER